MLDAEVRIELGAYCSMDLTVLSSAVTSKLREEFTFKNPAYAKAAAMGFRVINEPIRYLAYHESNNMIHIWRGGAKRVRAILEKYGMKVKWIDKRKVFEPIGLTFGSLKPFPEQMAGAKDLIAAQQGIGLGGTGVGKTETGLTAAIMVNQPTIIIVWNKDLLTQWKERILKYEILPESKIGIIQGPKNKFGPITIAMVQTLYKRVDEWKDRFGTLIMDEVQKNPAKTFSQTVNPFSAKYRWGLTADVERRDRKHFLAYECFGYQEYTEKQIKNSKSRKYFPVHKIQGLGQTLEPIIRIVPTRYEDETYEQERNFGGLINRLVENKERNALIAFYLKQELTNGRQVLLFTERVDATLYWSNLVSSWGFTGGPLIGGTDSAEETKASIDGLRDGRYRFGATTSYADVGIDIPSLDCAFITCPTGSNVKRINQQVGRIVRPFPGKKTPLAYYFWEKHVEGISKHINVIERRWDNIERYE